MDLSEVRVSHVIDRQLGIDYGWMYELRSEADVLDYWENVGQPRWSYGFADFLAVKDKTSHAKTAEGSLIYEVSSMTGRAPLLVMGQTVDRVHLGMMRSLPVVVNRNGGYFPLTHQEVKESREMAIWSLPGFPLKISQWPNGKHYYARIGDEDVVLNGRNKWDTQREAQHAAESFAKQKGITIELAVRP